MDITFTVIAFFDLLHFSHLVIIAKTIYRTCLYNASAYACLCVYRCSTNLSWTFYNFTTDVPKHFNQFFIQFGNSLSLPRKASSNQVNNIIFGRRNETQENGKRLESSFTFLQFVSKTRGTQFSYHNSQFSYLSGLGVE